MKRDKAINRALSIFFTILSLAWIYPVFMIALNSFKKATAISTTTAFDLLTPETFNGLANYVHALNEQGFASAFMYSLIITVTSVVLILLLHVRLVRGARQQQDLELLLLPVRLLDGRTVPDAHVHAVQPRGPHRL